MWAQRMFRLSKGVTAGAAISMQLNSATVVDCDGWKEHLVAAGTVIAGGALGATPLSAPGVDMFTDGSLAAYRRCPQLLPQLLLPMPHILAGLICCVHFLSRIVLNHRPRLLLAAHLLVLLAGAANLLPLVAAFIVCELQYTTLPTACRRTISRWQLLISRQWAPLTVLSLTSLHPSLQCPIVICVCVCCSVCAFVCVWLSVWLSLAHNQFIHLKTSPKTEPHVQTLHSSVPQTLYCGSKSDSCLEVRTAPPFGTFVLLERPGGAPLNN